MPRATAHERFFYLWGRPGSGRSHLLKGTVAALQRAGAAAVYIACTARTPGSRTASSAWTASRSTTWTGSTTRGRSRRSTCTTRCASATARCSPRGAAPPVQLTLREDLVTRLAWGLVYQVHALTDEDKAQALADHAASRGFRLPPEVCDFLLTRARRDLPSLLATLDALDRYSLETKRPVTVPLARELLDSVERGAPGAGRLDSGSRY